MWRKHLETLPLAGDDRTSGDKTLESRNRIEVRRDEKDGCVEPRDKPKHPTVAGDAAWRHREGKDSQLGTDAQPEAWHTDNARNWGETEKRIVLSKEVRERITTQSSATAERGAVAAW